jgi:hypothetical protein
VTNTETRLAEACDVLAQTVIAMQPLYQSTRTSDYQRGKLETMVGAALWYLPQLSAQLWTGRISIEALRALRDRTNMAPTHDHEWPRKVAARELFTLDWVPIDNPSVEVMQRYRTRYGRFNLVLPAENRRLAPFQRSDVFTTPELAYEAASVQLITTTHSLKTVLTGDSDLITTMLEDAAATVRP